MSQESFSATGEFCPIVATTFGGCVRTVSNLIPFPLLLGGKGWILHSFNCPSPLRRGI
jgi:hypothetical protein